jgi:hypothetical protein
MGEEDKVEEGGREGVGIRERKEEEGGGKRREEREGEEIFQSIFFKILRNLLRCRTLTVQTVLLLGET